MKTFSIRLPDDVRAELVRIAEQQGLKPGQLIRSLLIRMARARRIDQEVTI